MYIIRVTCGTPFQPCVTSQIGVTSKRHFLFLRRDEVVEEVLFSKQEVDL